MAKVNKVRRKTNSQRSRSNPYPLQSCHQKVPGDKSSKRECSKASEKKDWEDAICSVCMEFPHNAVLLLCSSYNKGCRPYMCATSHRYSNCLEQYKKAYTKVTSIEGSQQSNGMMDSSGFSLGVGQPSEKLEVPELLCPLCRGQVKGWTVVEPAREYLNAKKRSCMQDNCSFSGTYKQLRKHVKAKHPTARPRAVDPALEEKWKRLERERERNDVISTVMSSTPGAIVLGDYVLEPNQIGFYNDHETDADDYIDDNAFFSLPSFDLARSRHVFPHRTYRRFYSSLLQEDLAARRGAGTRPTAAPAGRGFGPILFGRRRQGQGGANRDR